MIKGMQEATFEGAQLVGLVAQATSWGITQVLGLAPEEGAGVVEHAHWDRENRAWVTRAEAGDPPELIAA